MGNVIEADFTQRKLDEDLQPIMLALVDCLYSHYGEEAGELLALGISTSLRSIADDIENSYKEGTDGGSPDSEST